MFEQFGATEVLSSHGFLTDYSESLDLQIHPTSSFPKNVPHDAVLSDILTCFQSRPPLKLNVKSNPLPFTSLDLPSLPATSLIQADLTTVTSLNLDPRLQAMSVHEIMTARVALASTHEDGEDPFFVADMGDIIRQYDQWIRALPRIEPFYGKKGQGFVDTIFLEIFLDVSSSFFIGSRISIFDQQLVHY